MGLFEHFPYTNFHDLNLNWILGKIKDIDSTVAGVHQAEENAAASAESAAESAESAAASAEAASGSAEEAAGSAEAAAEAEAGASGVVRDVSDRLTAFIQQHSGPSDETILYSAPGDPVYSGNLTLDEDPSTYMHLKIVWKHRNNVCVQEFPADMINDMYVRDTLGAPGTGGGSDLYEIAQMVLKHTTGTTVQIASARVVDSTGYASGDVDATMNTGVVRIVGVKNVADTEVVDARVGADGTIYPTLEDRLNAEYSELQSQIANGVPYEVRIALDNVLQNVAFENADGYSGDLAVIHNWATSVTLVSISAVFTQGDNAIYDTDSLDSLKQYLVVTASYDNGTTAVLADSAYTLSGTLTVGPSTITVTYGGKTATFNVTVSEATREMLFGVFSDGYAVAKQTGGQYSEYLPFAYRQQTAARATTPTPFTNNNYIFTVTDSTKYNIAVYDVDNMTELSIPSITQAVDGVGYHCGSKTVAWAAQDSATTPFAWIALKKMDGTAFTAEELADGAAAVFTYTAGE